MGFSLMPFGFFSENPTMGSPNPEFLQAQFPAIVKKQEGGDTTIEHE
jgi:primary-amine oxidase